MERLTIKDLLNNYSRHLHQNITIEGWVRAFRSNRFIALSDGSTILNLQVVVDFEQFDEEIIKNIKTASSLKITGEVVESQGAGQSIEILAKKIENLLTILFLKLIHKRRVVVVSEAMFENFYSSKVVFFLKK